MSKTVIVLISIIALIAIAGVAVGTVALVRSHAFSPVTMMAQLRGNDAVYGRQGGASVGGFGPGMMNNDRGRMGGRNFNDQDDFRRGGYAGMNGFNAGLLQDKMITAFAEKLGFTVDELNQQFTDGKSMLDIAADKGLTVEEFLQMHTDVHNEVIDQAVKDNLITQAQADLMKQNGGGMGFGMGMKGFGGRGPFSQNQPVQPDATQPTVEPTVAPTQQ